MAIRGLVDQHRSRAPRSTVRLFVAFAAITLVPVFVLGAVLAASYRSEARRRGIAEGRSEASLLGKTLIEPLLVSGDLSKGLTTEQWIETRQVVLKSIKDGDVVRLRIRDMAGYVVYSDDGSGFAEMPDEEALDVARGKLITKVTTVNADSNDHG